MDVDLSQETQETLSQKSTRQMLTPLSCSYTFELVCKHQTEFNLLTYHKGHNGNVFVIAGTGKEDVLLKMTWTVQMQEMAWILMTLLMNKVSLFNLLLPCLYTTQNLTSECDHDCSSTAQPSQLSQPSSQKTKSSISQDRYCVHLILLLGLSVAHDI